MWAFKKEYKDKKIGVRGFGILDTAKEDANVIGKLSLNNPRLVRFIEKVDAKQAKTNKSSE